MSYLGLILLFGHTAFTLSTKSLEPKDCISAEVLCKHDDLCYSPYLVLKNCSAADTPYLLNAPECQEAAELISHNPIFNCKCHRMKKEELCLNIYWTVHPVFIPGYLASYNSPYVDGIELKEEKRYTDRSTFVPDDTHIDQSNACLNEAAICSSSEKCSQLRNDYVIHCRPINSEGSCDRRKCHNHLRNFIKKIPMEFTKRLLFCPCDQDRYCGERRRMNIVPKCSFEEKVKRNCLELHDSCMDDNLCKSRLLDYQMQCRLFEKNKEACSPEQHDLCIKSYIRMIGTIVTPNFIDNSSMDTSLWCTCEGSANKEEECNAFLEMFTSNKCLQKVITTDINQSIPMSINDDQKSPTDGTNLAIISKKKQEKKLSSPNSGVSAPSFSMLSPALFLWLLKMVSFM